MFLKSRRDDPTNGKIGREGLAAPIMRHSRRRIPRPFGSDSLEGTQSSENISHKGMTMNQEAGPDGRDGCFQGRLVST